MKKLAVVAFGGNALLRGDQRGTIEEQEANAYDTCLKLSYLIKKDYNLVVTHGNGPQVGNILLQNVAGAKMFGIPEMPLDICGAYSQGFIGYILEQQMRNVLEERGLDRDVITIVSEVLVDKDDPAFKKPTKPIGPYYTVEEKDAIVKETGYVFQEDPRGRGWRRVVASPVPYKIANRHSISKMARDGQIVISVGGGGIPVHYSRPNQLRGIEAVIDKDLASSLLATQIQADEFIILTDVPKVYVNFRKPNEKALDIITVDEAKFYLKEGQFTEGSMAPKVRACLQFVELTGKDAIITEASHLGKEGSGTRFVLS
ncbi:MAG: carbamate kinase [Bacteroidetes bacterium RIFOXYA12_FULL_35_11]|nr:MAG: carbamate kinase [Bacteroidetes bacterium GWF2_35_48]OFY74120.1 MAG: carbamate kinase [Bacteroidetes bacterium RIFOXYA12_FULL_35_11]OFY93309.1 MAG: carbamate kinase [Bacteroidetes bacterium RIFOXYB2_FULL_35_7]